MVVSTDARSRKPSPSGNDTEPPTWTLSAAPSVRDNPTCLAIQAKVVDWNFVNIFVFIQSDNELCQKQQQAMASQALDACRRHYGRAVPAFGVTVHVFLASSDTRVVEKVEDSLLAALEASHEIISPAVKQLEQVSRTSLKPILRDDQFFLANTRLVRFRGDLFVAKGPIYASRVRDDFLEIRNLLELPIGHPHIIPPPVSLITVSDSDRRICGFLESFYEKGNLDLYAQKLRQMGCVTERLLITWFQQLVDAVSFLDRHGTWHGDLKPDNLLVSDDDGIVLIDFSRLFATFATASPEVRQHCRQAKKNGEARDCSPAPVKAKGEERVKLSTPKLARGIPPYWPLNRVARSEVYSIGRTMYLVCEGISMMDVYQRHGWCDEGHEFATSFTEKSLTPSRLRPIIEQCCQHEPADRPDLVVLADMLEQLSSASS